ncbi:MAG: hypothetical protein JW728_03240 [Candidatus Aureabacteria bacterium]|nr:hypothetical protein [Candidatus Auribacterota bacterium]
MERKFYLLCAFLSLVAVLGCATVEGDLDNPVKTVADAAAKGVSLKGEMQQQDRDSVNPMGIE